MERGYRPIVIVGLLVVLTGCLSGGPAGSVQSPTATPATTVTPAPTPTTTTPTACASWVSFYGLGSPGETAWEPDRIAIGYTVPANASVFFVAFEAGTVIGTSHVTTADREHGVTADGDGIQLERPLNGSHVIRVGAYRDTNGNGEFDRGTDTPCRSGGSLVEAGPRRIDFSTLQYRPGPVVTNTEP